MTKYSRSIKLCGALLGSLLFAGVAAATPISLGTITHDYGTNANRVTPTAGTLGGAYCDTVNGSSVTVMGSYTSSPKCQRFADNFDLSGIAYDSVDHFVLELAFSGAQDQENTTYLFGFPVWTTYEEWTVRPGFSYATEDGSNQTGPALGADGTQAFTFDNSLDVFNDILANDTFSLWFATNSPSNFEFTLDSASLELFGTPSSTGDAATAVPAPGVFLLFGASLMGLALVSRQRWQR